MPKAVSELEFGHGSIYGEEERAAVLAVLDANAPSCGPTAFYNVYCKGLLQRFEEIDIVIYSYITASIASIPLLVWVEPVPWHNFLAFGLSSGIAFAFLALFMYGASMLLFFAALARLNVTTASISLYLVPVFGFFLAITLLGERLHLLEILGAVIVLSATLLIVRYDKN